MTIIVSLNDKSFQKSFNLKVKALEKEEDHNPKDDESGENQDVDSLIVSAKFDGQVKGNTPIIDGWDLHAAKKGAYDTGWTSFRDNGEYVISAKFDEIDSVNVRFVYYLNNVSTSGNKSHATTLNKLT